MTGYVYHLQSIADDVCFASREFGERVACELACGSCQQMRPATAPLDVHLEYAPPRLPLTAIPWTVAVIRRDLLEALGADAVAADLHVGRVFFDGRELRDFFSARARRRIVVFGRDPRAPARTCEECGRAISSAVGPRYVVEAPEHRFRIAESQFPQPIVVPDIFDRVRSFCAVKRNKIWAEKVPVEVRGVE